MNGSQRRVAVTVGRIEGADEEVGSVGGDPGRPVSAPLVVDVVAHHGGEVHAVLIPPQVHEPFFEHDVEADEDLVVARHEPLVDLAPSNRRVDFAFEGVSTGVDVCGIVGDPIPALVHVVPAGQVTRFEAVFKDRGSKRLGVRRRSRRGEESGSEHGQGQAEDERPSGALHVDLLAPDAGHSTTLSSIANTLSAI